MCRNCSISKQVPCPCPGRESVILRAWPQSKASVTSIQIPRIHRKQLMQEPWGSDWLELSTASSQSSHLASSCWLSSLQSFLTNPFRWHFWILYFWCVLVLVCRPENTVPEPSPVYPEQGLQLRHTRQLWAKITVSNHAQKMPYQMLCQSSLPFRTWTWNGYEQILWHDVSWQFLMTPNLWNACSEIHWEYTLQLHPFFWLKTSDEPLSESPHFFASNDSSSF